jgi:hypothetical protein
VVSWSAGAHREGERDASHPRQGGGPVDSIHARMLVPGRCFKARFVRVSEVLTVALVQAAVYDLLPTDEDMVILTDPRTGKEEKALLTDADSLWVDLRHEHIADVGARSARHDLRNRLGHHRHRRRRRRHHHRHRRRRHHHHSHHHHDHLVTQDTSTLLTWVPGVEFERWSFG